MKMDSYTDYQKKTIAHILDRFQAKPPARRMLCSDEVGLGKTFVAKGVIWGTALKCLKEGKDRLDVLYLCPNLNIADQNKRELGIQAEEGSKALSKKTLSKLENRSTMLYLQVLRDENKSICGKDLCGLYEAATGKTGSLSLEEKEKKITISVFPVTPDTSIDVDSAGDKREREYIFRMIKLCGYKVDVDEIDSRVYKEEFDLFSEKEEKIEVFREKFDAVLGEFDRQAVENKKNNKVEINKVEWALLRKAFAITTIQLIPYDLVIMDEFQNFTDIIHGANMNVKAKDFFRKQRMIMLSFMKKLGINNSYIKWLEDQDEYFYNLSDEKQDKAVEAVFMDIDKDRICNICNEEIKLLKETAASKEGESNLKETFEDVICKLLQVNVPNSERKKILSGDKHWNIVRSIMEDKSPDCQYEVESISPYYEEISEKLNGWKEKNKTELEEMEYTIPEKVNPWRLMRIGTECALSEMEKLYSILRDESGVDLRGIKKSDHPYAEIKEWALEGIKNNESEIEQRFFRMVLMNLMNYHLKKTEELSIEPEYGLWEYLKEKEIDNYDISYAVVLLWYHFVYCGQISDSFKDTKSAIIEEIFSHEAGRNTRILMLSATPFKLYSEEDEDEKAEGSLRKETIETVCNFLQESGTLSEKLKVYKNSVKEYSLGQKKLNDVSTLKNEFEAEMIKYFTRMERNSVVRELNSLQIDKKREDEECVSGRIAELAEYVDELTELIDSRSEAVKYAKQIPYALSFMPGGGSHSADEINDGYKVKQSFLKKYKEAAIPETDFSILKKDDFECYTSFCGEYHGVFREMLYRILQLEDKKENANKPGAGSLLWIPPLAVKQDELKGAFEEYYGYGKTIIFSAWAMIPRGIATLISYEVRRRLLYTVFPKWQEYTADEKKKIISKIDAIREAILKQISELIDNNNKKRVWQLWHSLIKSDITSILAVWSQTVKGNIKENLLSTDAKNHIQYIEEYSKMGRLDKVLEEYDYMTAKSDGDEEFGFIKSSNLDILLKEKDHYTTEKERSFFARGIGSSKDDDKINAIKNLQKAYNSPFAPFVFATTSMGQEGLNFHAYADKVIHWNLPSNPVDFEQREGRINRRNCFVIRRKLVEKYAGESEFELTTEKFFDRLFEKVRELWVENNKNPLINCGMIPNWILPYEENGKCHYVKITRIVPYFAMDSEVEKYHKNLKILQLYRSVIGQPDPEELLERLIGKSNDESVLEELYLDFSPYRKEPSKM